MKKFKLKIAALLAAALLFSNIGMPVSGIAASASDVSEGGATGKVTVEPEVTADPEVTAEPEATPDPPDNTTYLTVDGGEHGMYSPDKEMTIVIFCYPECSYAKLGLEVLGEMGLSSEKIDICCVDAWNEGDEAKTGMQQFAEEMALPNVTYCYCEEATKVIEGNTFYYATEAKQALIQYTRKYAPHSALGSPTYVFTDKNGVVQHVQFGALVTSTEVIELMDSLGYGHLIPEETRPKFVEAECEVTYGQTNARQMLSRVNEFRTGDNAWEYDYQGNKIQHTDLTELTYDYELEKIAMQRAAELIASFEHTRPNEFSAYSAYSKEFAGASTGENIAIGKGDDFLEEAVFTGWKEEDKDYAGQGHRRNMLQSSFKSIGIAHVIYKGWHYWVQEFSDRIVNDTETEANDSLTKVNISISEKNIKDQMLIPLEDPVTIKVGERIPAPQVHLAITTYSTRPNAPALELLEPITAKWSVDMFDMSWLKIDDDGSLYALKPGETFVSAQYNNAYGAIALTVEAAEATPTPSTTPDTSVEPTSSAMPAPSTTPISSSMPVPTVTPDFSSKPAPSIRPTASVTSSAKPKVSQKPTTTSKPSSSKKPASTSGSAKVGTTITVSSSKDVFVVTSAGSTGKMPEAAYKKTANPKAKKVTIPSTIKVDDVTYRVTSIASKALKGNKTITTVKIPDTVKTIGASAFQNCSALKNITIGKGVITIDKNAFKKCKKLTKITVNSSIIRVVGKNAFKGISKKVKIKVPGVKRNSYRILFIRAGLAGNVKWES